MYIGSQSTTSLCVSASGFNNDSAVLFFLCALVAQWSFKPRSRASATFLHLVVQSRASRCSDLENHRRLPDG